MTRHPHRLLLALVSGLALLAAGLASAGSPAAAVGRAPSSAAATTAAHNPLAQHPWGVYHGLADQAWQPYLNAGLAQQQLLDSIVQQPKVQWFHRGITNGDVASRVHLFIENATGGDPDVLVQMAIFRMDPWEGDACTSLPTDAQQSSYKTWVRRAAQAIGSSYVALVLQPDGPFALCAPGGSKLPSHLIRYAARQFAANPNTSVYIDAGAADWNRSDPARALQMLLPGGIAVPGVRGFALASTHYDSTADEVEYGTAVVKALAARGITGKHFVVNTAANGRPFAGYSYHGPDFNNARVCTAKVSDPCVALGIPPTPDVANPRWGLADDVAADALKHCDGYVWVGRPWLYRQAAPFSMTRALQLAKMNPYA